MGLLDFIQSKINPDPYANVAGPQGLDELIAATERAQAPWGRGADYPVDYSGAGGSELQNPSQPSNTAMSQGADANGLFNYATGLRQTAEGVMPSRRDLTGADPSDLSTSSVNSSGRVNYAAKPSGPQPIIQNLAQLQAVMKGLAGVPDELKTRLLSQWTGIPLTSEKAQALQNAIAQAVTRHQLSAPEREQAAKDREARIKETIQRDKDMAIYRKDLLGLHRSAQAQMMMRRLDSLIQNKEKLPHLVSDPKTGTQIPNPAMALYDKEIDRLNKSLDDYYSNATENIGGEASSGAGGPSGSRMTLPPALQQLQSQGARVELIQ